MNRIEINTIIHKLKGQKIKNIVYLGSIIDHRSKNYVLFYEDEDFTFNIFLDIHNEGNAGKTLSHSTKIKQIEHYVKENKALVRKICLAKTQASYLSNSQEKLDRISNFAKLQLDNMEYVKGSKMKKYEKHEVEEAVRKTSYYTEDGLELLRETLKKLGYDATDIGEIQNIPFKK